jgi:hypothetical protein
MLQSGIRAQQQSWVCYKVVLKPKRRDGYATNSYQIPTGEMGRLQSGIIDVGYSIGPSRACYRIEVLLE